MIRRSQPPVRARRYRAAAVASLAVGLGLLTGCGVQGSSAECGPDSCLVTFSRAVEAKATVFGVDASLVGVSPPDTLTVQVAGEQVSLSADQQAARVADLYVSFEAVDGEQAVIRIGRTPSS